MLMIDQPDEQTLIRNLSNANARLTKALTALTAERDAERALAANVLAAWQKVGAPDYNGEEDWDRLVVAMDQLSAAHSEEKPVSMI